jgi:hypothetical protein
MMYVTAVIFVGLPPFQFSSLILLWGGLIFCFIVRRHTITMEY